MEEEDLLKVIQVINENKGPDTYIRSDVDGEFTKRSGGRDGDAKLRLIVDDLFEAGEFSIDLYRNCRMAGLASPGGRRTGSISRQRVAMGFASAGRQGTNTRRWG